MLTCTSTQLASVQKGKTNMYTYSLILLNISSYKMLNRGSLITPVCKMCSKVIMPQF